MALPKMSISELQSASAQDLVRKGTTYEVTCNDKTIAVLVVPQTDFILDQVRGLGEMSNSVRRA